MKLRLRGDTLRLRLLRSEVEKLLDLGSITETVHFPGSTLSYALIQRGEIETPFAQFENGFIRVFVPSITAKEWATTDQVSLTANQTVGEETVLRLLIEKDFTCLKPRSHWHEDETDTFSNPNTTCG